MYNQAMAKRETFTEAQLHELQRAYTLEKDGATRTRLQAVKLYGQGYRVATILDLTSSSRSALMQWCRKYRTNGLPGLQDHRGGAQNAKLTSAQLAELAEKLRQYCPYDVLGPQSHTASGAHWTVRDVAQALEKWYGVQWQSRASYAQLLAACGFSYQRTEKVYKSRREREVLEFEAAVEKKSST
jgi:transposase